MNNVIIFVNEQAVYEYDRAVVLNDSQLGFLDKMDVDMGRGIKIRGELVSAPDNQQRAIFVAMNLIKALQQENEAAISVSCAYLASRLPGLLEVRANDREGSVVIEFVNE